MKVSKPLLDLSDDDDDDDDGGDNESRYWLGRGVRTYSEEEESMLKAAAVASVSKNKKTTKGKKKDEHRHLLTRSARELWILLFVITTLDNASQFSLQRNATIYFREEFGMSDREAAGLYGYWGLSQAIGTVSLGVAVDRLGVKTSCVLGYLAVAGSQLLLALTNDRLTMEIIILTVQPLFDALAWPATIAGISALTAGGSEGDRSVAFGLYYSLKMLGMGILGGAIIDVTNHYVGDDGVTIAGRQFSNARVVILVGVVAKLFVCLVSATCLRRKQLEEGQGDVVAAAASDRPSMVFYERLSLGDRLTFPTAPRRGNKAVEFDRRATFGASLSSSSSSAHAIVIEEQKNVSSSSACSIFRETVSSSSFWKLTALTALLANLAYLFRTYMDAVMPSYLVREFGDNTPYGLMISITSLTVIVGVPIVHSATAHYSAFDVIHVGAWIGGVSAFTLAIDSSMPSTIAFLVFMALGEAFWSPRWMDFITQVAPPGRVGTYTSLSSFPLQAGRAPAGILAGYFLSRFCPDEGEEQDGCADPKSLWLYVALVSVSAPVLITLLRGWLRESATASPSSSIQ